MSAIVQRLRTDYSGKDAAVDVLIERYANLEADTQAWREQINMDGLTHHLESGFFFAHPLIKHVLTMERLLHVTLRELMFAVRLIDFSKGEVDEVDTFLAQMQQGTKPHFGRIHGQ